MSVFALALVAAACGGGETGRDAAERPATGDDTTEPNPDASDGGATAVTIVGENISFDTTELSAGVGEELEITFDHRDDGIRHNLHVRDTATGDEMTEITEGPVTQTLIVSFDEPGEFEYFCEVHPAAMTGTITIE